MKLASLLIKRKNFNKNIQYANYYCEKTETKNNLNHLVSNNNKLFDLLQKIYAKNEQIEKILLDIKKCIESQTKKN